MTKPLNVLIIEDVDEMRHLLEQVMGGIAGIKISGLTANGWDARVEITRRRPDLILLDEILPGESGLDLLTDFHAQEIPVILMTGVEEPDHELPSQALARIIKPAWDSMERDRARIQEAIQRAFQGVRQKRG